MAADPVAVAASNNPMLKTLTQALSGQLNPNVNLVETLNSNPGLTVFAPTDDAFAKIDAATLETLKTDSDLLTSILTYHVVEGQAAPTSVAGDHKTLEGGSVTRDRSRPRPEGQRRRPGVRRRPDRQRDGLHDRHGPDAPGQLGDFPTSRRELAPKSPTVLLSGTFAPARPVQGTPMTTLALIGFLGGLITGISPCILPVLPVIFFSGTQSTRADATGSAGGVAVEAKPTLSDRLRPYRVIGGLVLSFSVVTLAGSALLSLLHLPQDAIRWFALIALVTIGVGLIFPKFEAILEKPFSKLPQKQFGSGSSGFGLGLALGVLYVPCAGPVLAAIVIAGATGTIGVPTIVLTLAFAIGAALPLLFFALAGRRVAERVAAFRRRQREIRITAGVVTILLAVALAFNVPAALQRAIPDYTSTLQETRGRRRADPREAQPRRPRQRPEQRTRRTVPTAPPSWKAVARHRISRTSPPG